MKLALFDLDHTLIDGDSDVSWAQFLIEEGVLRAGGVPREEPCGSPSATRTARSTSTSSSTSSWRRSRSRPRTQLDAWHRAVHAAQDPPDHPCRRAPELLARHDGRARGARHRDQPLHHRPDRRRARHRRTSSPPTSRRSAASSPASRAARPRSARARSRACTSGSPRAATRLADLRKLVLQRLAERPAAARARRPSGRGGSRRHAASARRRTRGWHVISLEGT